MLIICTVMVCKSQLQAKIKSVQGYTRHTEGLLRKEFGLNIACLDVTLLLETNIATGYSGCLAWE